jgi:hypothetical protein
MRDDSVSGAEVFMPYCPVYRGKTFRMGQTAELHSVLG